MILLRIPFTTNLLLAVAVPIFVLSSVAGRAQNLPNVGPVPGASGHYSTLTNPSFEQDSFSKLDRLSEIMVHQTAAERAEKRREAALAELRFVDRFNHLVDTALDFSRNYNANHTVDLKRIKALRKAWYDLEKDSGFLKVRERAVSDHH